MERARLSAARLKKHWTLEEAAAELGVDRSTLLRWEKGKTTPQPMHVRKLCEIYGVSSASELDLEEEDSAGTQSATISDELDDVYTSYCKQALILRLLHIVWNWSSHTARYHELQTLLMLELEDNSTMDDMISRRDALRLLASLPIEYCGLSALVAVFTRPSEEILTQCASGITACWYLRRGKELAFVDNVISKYIPTLKAIVVQGTAPQRKAAADLLAQCFLLKSTLAKHITNNNDAISYAVQAEKYGAIAENTILQIVALRKQDAAYWYANHWEQSLHAAEKAKHLLEEKQKVSPSHQAQEHIPQLVKSYVYAGLASSQAGYGEKKDALPSLKKAQTAFFSQSPDEKSFVWVDHNEENLILNDGITHLYLGMYKEAFDSFGQVANLNNSASCVEMHIEALINQVMVELSRDDKPRDMELCITLWTQGIQGAIALQSEQWFNEAMQAYQAMRAAWPREQYIKELRDLIIHW